jgi:protein phosphatase
MAGSSAQFHLLASEGAVYTDKDHIQHMDILARLCNELLFIATPYKGIGVTNLASQAEGIAWWDALTGRDGEKMVAKSFSFVYRDVDVEY